jgi:hypothetical protein
LAACPTGAIVEHFNLNFEHFIAEPFIAEPFVVEHFVAKANRSIAYRTI